MSFNKTMIFKYNDSFIKFSSNLNINIEKDFFEKNDRKKRLKDAFDKIDFIFINDNLDYDEVKLPSYVKKMSEDELLDKIYDKEYRYSDFKNDNNRFRFYHDFEKEIRSVLVGTTNFLVIEQMYYYQTKSTVNLDDETKEDDYF